MPPKHGHLVIQKQHSEKSLCEIIIPALNRIYFLEKAVWSFTYMRFRQVFKRDTSSLAGAFEEQYTQQRKKTSKISHLEIPTYVNKIALHKNLKSFEFNEAHLFSISFWAPLTT